MIELTFITAGELVKFRVNNKKIQFSGKPTNFMFVDWNPLLPADKLTKLKIKKGERWYQEYQKAEDTFLNLASDEDIADDLTKDFKKRGLKLVRKTDTTIPVEK